MSTIMHHPDPVTLVSFAAGNLAEALAAVVVAHVDLCETCRAEVADLELMGGLLLTEAKAGCASAAAIALPEWPPPVGLRDNPSPRPAVHVDPDGRLPRPLASAFRLSFDTIPWKRLGPGVWHHRLPMTPGAVGDLRLLKIGPGRIMPDHGHGGSELTLVLDGAYRDQSGSYRRGDIQDVDETVDHTPVADKETGCICLIASERPARFNGLIGRLMQPWTGM